MSEETTAPDIQKLVGYDPFSAEPDTQPRNLDAQNIIQLADSSMPFLLKVIDSRHMVEAGISTVVFPVKGVLIISGAPVPEHAFETVPTIIMPKINAGYNEGLVDADLGTWFDYYPLADGDRVNSVVERHRNRWNQRLQRMTIDKHFPIQDNMGLAIKWSDLKAMDFQWQIQFVRLMSEMGRKIGGKN